MHGTAPTTIIVSSSFNLGKVWFLDPDYAPPKLSSGYDGDLPITESEALDMVRHIYTHCTKIQVEVLSLDTEDLDSDKFLDVLAQFVLPHTRYLHFEGLYGCPVESRKLKYLLDHCSNMLEELSFNIDLQHNDNDMDQEQKDTEPWPVKQLSLQRCGDKSDKSDKSDSTFWRWLWKRCSQVKRLQVTGVGDIIQSLEYGMFVHMLNLNSILLEGQPLPKGGVAAILSSCRNGWKDIRLKREMDVDGLAKEILMEHCRALERLEVEGYPGFESNDIIQMAASSPNLHTLIDVDDNSYWADTQSRLHADAFIDRDPSTGSLRPWACENNLEKLKVRITGIPRPDLEQCTIAFELYPGQGREIQSYVYDRLARLTNLKTLWLGGFGYGPYFYTGYEYTYDWNVSRYDCLEMSLSSGLWKLAGLKALKKLGVANVEPSAHDLLCHLYKHCSAMQVQDLLLFTKDLHSVVLMKALARYVLPLTHHLEVKSVPSDPYLTSSMLQHLLDHCSQLEELILHISGLYDGDDSEDEQNWTAMPGTFKQLTLFRCADKESESKMFWSWFWRRCGQVERLKLRDVADITQILVKGMAIHMVKLHAITFRDAGSRPLNDEEVSGILSSSLHGWRRVEMRNMTIERDAKSALARHYPTLEGLLFHELQGFGDNDMVQVLSSCPNLRVMVDLGYRVSNRILAEDFVDRDSTDSLKPWACEVTLRELKVKVSGIPRPEVRECHIKERHPGQGHEIQSQVYDRLARLTNLEVLWLGDIHEMGVQNECLEMSLKSGLYKLSGLKKLKELNISGMETRMDMNEIQWITQNWPQLRIIYGLEWRCDKDTVRWLRLNSKIKVRGAASEE
ncbi:hypothetical protein BGX31_001748 [Mortierella sp. GBA43]|nr:hypothetical protein BGX31_001748 [Mortierella sp. GBA43]